MVTELRELASQNAAAHAEYRADINRLYAAWPAHMRESHGGAS